MRQLHQVVAFDGALEFLRELESSPRTAYERPEILALMRSSGIGDPEANLSELVAASLLHSRGESYGLTTFGIRTCLLLEAINGGDLKAIYRRLNRLDTSLRTYELIREGMTLAFLRNLNQRPGFGRLYSCSPWISLDRKQSDLLVHAVHQVEMKRGSMPEILVIARPEQGSDTVVPAALKPFQDLGAAVFLNKRLHTKLYIREPDRSGGYAMAIVGSQNLTKSRYLELGIRINSDAAMIGQLIAYFFQITNYSYEA